MPPQPTEYSAFAHQHRNLLDQYRALTTFRHDLYNRIAMYGMASAMRINPDGTTSAKRSSLLAITSEALELAKLAGLSDPPVTRAIHTYLKWVAATAKRIGRAKSGRLRHVRSPSEKLIDAAVSRRRAEIEVGLKRIPPSVEKAVVALGEEVSSDDDGPPDALCFFGVDDARRRFRANIESRRQDLLSGRAMRSSALGYEAYWYASYLRYYETFEAKDARALLLTEANDIGDELRSTASAIESVGEHAPYELPQFMDRMLAYGRCRTVRYALLSIARRTIPTVLRWQKANGAWSDWTLRRRGGRRGSAAPHLVDSPGVTACAVVFLARYGLPEEYGAAFARSQRWLIDGQNEDGSWYSTRTGALELPISTTVQVLEALRHTGLPLDHPAVLRGEAFLIKQQQPPGLWWEKSGVWQTHITAQVLEYFQSRTERPGTLNSYLKSARALLLKSEQLTLSQDHADGPLATVAAYHGVEHFLYGCLLEMDSDEAIYADTKGATIGFSAALGAFERTLKVRNELRHNSRLSYRQQLQHLSAKRDMFIHRAESISASDAFGFVALCRSFVGKYDLPVLGFRLYD